MVMGIDPVWGRSETERIEPVWTNDNAHWNKTAGNQLNLPEKLDTVGRKIAEAIYLDPGQKYSTMG